MNDTTLVDAGSAASALSIESQSGVQDLLLSHAHIDHVAELCFLLDNTFDRRNEPLRLRCLNETDQALRNHLFNGNLWPDLLGEGFDGPPVLAIHPLEPGRPFTVGPAGGQVEVTAIPVNHVVPTVGFLLAGTGGSLIYTADTAPTQAIWQAAENVPNPMAVITEASFPNEMEEIARITGHMTPVMVQAELKKMPPEIPVYLFHAKPPYLDVMREQVEALGEPRLRWLEEGRTYDFGT